MVFSAKSKRIRLLVLIVLLFPLTNWGKTQEAGIPNSISYYEDIRPVFQAKCQGCHQPARSKADLVLTDVANMIAGGEGGEPVIVPHKPELSYLIDLVTLQEGDERPEMPEKDEPLTPYELSLVTKWIEQGAIDDTPENAKQRYDRDHPPQYAVSPVLTSLDFSPDGEMLAVAGFHEVLIHKADGSGLITRLVGLSERIESARFSPDGQRLAVAGGLPGRMGEIQIWDLTENKLLRSKPVGYDTAYGASWSPDGNYISYGLPDNTVRAFDVSNGEEILFMGSHSDWILDTAWSVNGDHIVSVGRDMSAKLTHVETERFIDNITSITPGALKGGMNAIDSHPVWDHILVGGSDGIPQIYRMHRETHRKVGDNANLIRKYPAMIGRIWSAAFAPDGKTFAAVSSLNGKGQINIYRSDYDATITPELKELFETARTNPDGTQNIEPEIEAFHTEGAELLYSINVDSPVYSVAYSPDGKTVAAGTSDGRVQFIDAMTGESRKTLIPVDVTDSATLAKAEIKRPDNPISLKKAKTQAGHNNLVDGQRLRSLSISPASIELTGPMTYNQILVTGELRSGDSIDLTREVEWSISRTVATVDKRGIIRPDSAGKATLTASFKGKKAVAKVSSTGFETTYHPDYLVDVNPILTRLGCNAGLCHGAKDGKGGFKLSLRGYDSVYDVRAFGDDHAARRVNFASPDDSLMLLKSTGAVPHEGGMVTEVGSDYYETIRKWISEGAVLNAESKKVSRIELLPQNPVIQTIGSSQQMRIIAHYPDGSKQDVTQESFIEIGNIDVAEADDFGLITTIRRGEAPILARYEGAYAATTVTVMGDRAGFVWKEPKSWNEIDQLVAAKWKRLMISPSDLTTDSEFIRRIHLDLIGLPPSPDTVIRFLADRRSTQEKRAEIIDSLIGSPDFVDHWSNKWADMLQVNSKFLGKEGSQLFRDWIRDQVEENKPYNEFVYSILTASGSNKENPPASYYKILRTPEELVENTTHLFLATRFNCNKCHDHPFEKWNVDNYYQTAAFFSQIGLERDKKNAEKENIGGSAVDNATPLYELISDITEGSVTNIVTGEIAEPTFPFSAIKHTVYPSSMGDKNSWEPSRREQLAAWITAEDNQFFAKSYANRIWGYLTGTGIIEPIDDIRAGNPPTNPELLNHLTDFFIDSGFNVRALISEICNSRTYQLSFRTNTFNEDDTINYSHGKARRLPAEVIFDAVYSVTGATPNIPGAKPGMRAAQLPDAKLDTKSGFLATLGRPTRESACECDRQNDVQLGAVMSLLSGPSIAEAVGDPRNAISKLVKTEPDDRELIDQLYLRVLNRKPSNKEIEVVQENWSLIEGDHNTLVDQLAEMERDWVYRKAALDAQRFQNISNAQFDVDEYMPEFKAKKAAANKARRNQIKITEKSLADFEWNSLPTNQTAALQSITADRLLTQWEPLVPEKAEASAKGIKLTINEDASILASGEIGKNVDYTLTIPIKDKRISGFMLEVLVDDLLPGFGPGLNESGNFVISEIKIDYRQDPEAEKETPLKLVDVAADYTEEEFNATYVINGNRDRNDKAWAVGGQERRPHWLRLKLDQPFVVDEKGLTLTITIECRYSDGDFPVGKFRLLTTGSEDPLNLGLPSNISAVLNKAPDLRIEDEVSMLEEWYKYQDPDYLAKRFDWVKAKKPLPIDEKMESLKMALGWAERPFLDDPVLVQLRSDVLHSVQQDGNRRLTAAQDLAWALINNSAFIFNY